jgi:predicted secreted acid phosphatase
MLSLRCLAAACMSLALVACNTVPAKHETVAATAAAHDNLNAVLWMQSAAEYEATTRGVYAAARASLARALADPAWNALPEDERQEGFESLPPAIIVDADETMIDNSPFQVRAIRDGKAFVYADWLAWVNERRARALPWRGRVRERGGGPRRHHLLHHQP